MVALQIARLVGVLALLIVAALLATPPGRLPLALRGVYKILRRDRGLPAAVPAGGAASTGKRLLAFLLVLVAAALAIAAEQPGACLPVGK